MFDNRIVAIHAVDESTFSPQRLVRYVRTMRRLGYRFVTVDTLLQAKPGKRLLALTVDDAYATTTHILLPLLQRLEVPALIFVPTGLLGLEANHPQLIQNEMYHGQATMTADDLNLWLAAGFDIGFHTHMHLDLYHAPTEAAIEDDFRAGMALWQSRGWPVRHFAYPKGFLPRNRRHFCSLMEECGFQYAHTINWGAARAKDKWYVCRVCLGNQENFQWTIAKTLGLADAIFRIKRQHMEQKV